MTIEKVPHNLLVASQALLVVAALAQFGCSSSGKRFPLPENFDADAPYSVMITGANVSPVINNVFFPAPVGATWQYEAVTDDGTEHIDVVVLDATDPNGAKVIMGADARVVRDTVTLDGEVIEDTWDWYGQDAEGNVWYLGEDTSEYQNGQFVCNCGAWEWGIDGALPGYVMLADPQVGDAYRQEYYAGEAEDVAEIVALDETVNVAAGMFTGCAKTRDVSTLDRSYEEFKYYCPGVGLVLEEEGGERVELISYSGLAPI